MSAWVSDRALRLALILGATIGALAVLYFLAMVVFIGAVFLGMGWPGTAKGLFAAMKPAGHLMAVSVLGACMGAAPVALAMPKRYWGYGAAVGGVAGATFAAYVPVVERMLGKLACWGVVQLGPDLCAF